MNVGRDLVVETSAIVAIHHREVDAEALQLVLQGNKNLHLPVSCYLEATMVLSRFAGSRQWIDTLVRDLDIVILPCDERQARLAADAFERYGRGRHTARLNFGDCLSYAAAKALDAPLLFKGNDFGHTDIKRPA